MGRGDALLLLGDGAPALLHLLNEELLDLALRALRDLRKRGELFVVSLPAVRIEEVLGLLELALLGECADVGDHAADLAGGTDFGGTLPLRRRGRSR